jgi:hypothetical protein
VVARGVVLRFTCSEACTVDVRLLIGRAAALRMGMRIGPSRLLVARAPASVAAAGGGRLTLILPGRVAGHLRTAARGDFILYAKARDHSGNAKKLQKKLEILPAKARLTRRKGDLAGSDPCKGALAGADPVKPTWRGLTP